MLYIGNSNVRCELQLGQAYESTSVVAHSYYDSLHISPFMIPAGAYNGTKLGIYYEDNAISLYRRYGWWFLEAAKLIGTGLALYE